MRVFFLMLSLIIPISALGEDGLMIQFTIEESAKDSNLTQSYTNAILMRFNEQLLFDFQNLNTIKFTSKVIDNKSINLVTSLKDLSDDQPYYVGEESINIAIDSQVRLHFETDNNNYSVSLDTSYGEIP